MHGKVKKYFKVSGREHLGDINIDRIILTWILHKV
jgi:hypothetical protein